MKNLKKISLASILFITLLALSMASVVNAVGVNATIKVGLFPEGIAYDSGKGELFVANWLSDSVSVISDNTDTVLTNITVGSNPNGVAYDSGKDELFVANWLSNSVSVISDSTNTVV